VCPTLLKTLPMLAATVDKLAVAASATSATTSAYSIRSCPLSSSRALAPMNVPIRHAPALDPPDDPPCGTVHSEALGRPLREFVSKDSSDQLLVALTRTHERSLLTAVY